MKFRIMCSAMALLLGAAVSSHAVTINEAGDFSNTSSSPSILATFDSAGVHSVSGHVDYLGGDSFDFFTISLLQGLNVSSIQWRTSNVVDQGGGLNNETVLIKPQTGAWTFIAYYDTTPPAGDSKGDIWFSSYHDSRSFGAAAGFPNLNTLTVSPAGATAFDWQMDFTVQGTPVATPEPSTCVLMGLGLAGAIAAGRRRRGPKA